MSVACCEALSSRPSGIIIFASASIGHQGNLAILLLGLGDSETAEQPQCVAAVENSSDSLAEQVGAIDAFIGCPSNTLSPYVHCVSIASIHRLASIDHERRHITVAETDPRDSSRWLSYPVSLVSLGRKVASG